MAEAKKKVEGCGYIPFKSFNEIDFSIRGFWQGPITPNDARSIVGKQKLPNNREVKRRHEEYVRDMRAGIWLPYTGETIKFAEGGCYYIDGNNRLHAIIEADVTVETTICTGVPMEALKVIDSGIMRSVGDIVKLVLNVPNSTAVAAMARKAMLLNNGSDCIGTHVGVNVMPTYQEVVEFVRANNEALQELHKDGRRAYDALQVPGMGITGWFICHWLTSLMDREKGDEFYEQVIGRNGVARAYVMDAMLKNDIGKYQSREWLCYKYVENFDRIMMGRETIIGRDSDDVVKSYKATFRRYLDNMREKECVSNGTYFDWSK